ncbi:MAG: hypothetical protein ACOCX2_13295, partial [Armatimonadota bacterium]
MIVTLLRNPRRDPARGILAALAAIVLGLALPTLATAAEDTRPEPMIFMTGLHGPDAVRTIRAINQDYPSLNTLYYDLPEDAPLKLDEIRSHIRQAAQADLRVIVGLRTKLGRAHQISARNDRYVDALREWLQAVVGGLAGTDGITAWATDHDLERDIAYTDEQFQAFLLERHGSLAAINAGWDTDLRMLGELTRQKADELDHDQTHGVGRPSIDLAEYQRNAFRDVMALWTREVRRLDPDTP